MWRVAIQFIRYDKAKSIGIVIGIVISIFLIGQQLGILGFLTGLMGGLVENSRQEVGQIWVVDNITSNANELSPLDERLVRELRSVPGVQATYGLVAANASVKFASGKTAPILLIGSEAPVFVGGPRLDRIRAGSLADLSADGAVSAEYYDESTFGQPLAVGTRVEIGGKEATIRLQTQNARGFAGSFFYTSISKARWYGNFPANKVSAVAVQVQPGQSVAEVCARINGRFQGVRAWDAQELKNTTIAFITISSNIGTSVGSLVVFAIISGFFIIGLTLYSAALDRMRDYGTLKAIGATDTYVRKLILTQAVLFAGLGFLLAWALLEAFRSGVANAGLVFSYSPAQLLGLLGITLFISVGGSLFAIRKINSVEPASVFRG
ncbi:MAG: ABC transporter permease [Sphingobacteriaceae bacterium]|nr:ABC transporter permease [Sphingobacteriaceae bacterium]